MSQFSSNISLLIISLILAVGLVSIKGQEKINRRYFSGIQVTVENLPPNIMLPPDPWMSPMVSLTVQGPKNFIEFIRTDRASLRINYANVPSPESDKHVTVLLNNDMFVTNLDPQDTSKIMVDNETIRPRQAVLKIFSWDIDGPIPELSREGIEPDRVFIPLLQIQKNIPIEVTQEGRLPDGYSISILDVDPPSIKVTGRRDAVDQVKSVSTTPILLDFISIDQNEKTPLKIPLSSLGDINVQPVNEDIRDVTVTVQVTHNQ